MTGPIFSHPFEDDGILDQNPKVAELYKGLAEIKDLAEQYDEIDQSDGVVDYTDLEAWFEKAAPIEKRLKAKEKRLREHTTKLREEAENLARVEIEADEEEQQVSQHMDELGDTLENQVKCIEEQFRMSIRFLVHLKGKNDVLKMMQEELEQETEEQAVVSVPIEIQRACRNYLPGGQEVSTWDMTEVCDLIKDAEIRFQKSATNPVPHTPQRLKLPADHLQRLIDRNQSNSQRESSIISTSSPRRMQSISVRPRVPPPVLNLTRSSSDPALDRADVQMVPLAEKEALESKLEGVTIDLANSRLEVHTLEAQLLRNQLYNMQVRGADLGDIASKMRKSLSCLPPPPYFHSRHALVLADDFDNLPLRPVGPYSWHYLQSINEDISGSKAPDHVRKLVKQHLPWLSTQIKDILKSAQDFDLSLFLHYLQQVLPTVFPKGIARPALFFLVSNLTQRCDDLSDSLWLDLYQQIIVGSYGHPFKEWDLLDRIALCWFLSVGDDASISELHMSEDEEDQILTLTSALRRDRPKDIISLLEHSAVVDMVINEDLDSRLAWLKDSAVKHVVIIRTGSAATHGTDREYIFTKYGGKVYFSQQGFELSLSWDGKQKGLTKLVRARRIEEGEWFNLEGPSAEEYFHDFHTELIGEAAAKYRAEVESEQES